MQLLRQNTAVIITVGPFYDRGDGVTIETALTITNERITLTADTDNGSAPTNILDNVTGATSGTNNDLNYITGNDAGMMQLELTAADTNRVGRMKLSITDAANHVPVFEDFFVLPQAIYDWLTGVIIPLPANATQLAGQTITAGAGVTFPSSVASPTNITAGTITTATNLTNAPTAGDFTATMKTSLNAATPASVQNISAQTGDSFARLGAPAGASVSADIAAIEAQTDDIGVAGAGLTALGDARLANLDATVSSRLSTAGYTAPDNTTIGTINTNIGTPANLGGGATLAQNLSDIEGQTEDIGVAGAGLTALGDARIANLDAAISTRATPTNITAGTITTVTNLTNAPTVGDLTATMKASVNAEVLDVLTVDTFAQPGQEAPAATNTLKNMLAYAFKFLRNRVTQTSTTLSVFADNGTTVDQKATISDDSTTYDRGEIGSGP